ncbi:MAG: hypothetical protein C4305_09395 [Thermoleophilia bacterium]
MVVLELSELAGVRMAGAGEEQRLRGRPTLVLDTRSGRRFQVATVSGVGGLREVADIVALQLASLS